MKDDREQRCSSASGQAMIEFLVGLVAVLALTAGILQVADLTRTHTETMVEARREAGRLAIMDMDILSSPHYIRDWEEGPDGKRHTSDDEFTLAATGEFYDTIIAKASPDSAGWDFIDGVPENRLSGLHDSGASVSQFGLVRGHDERTVELISAVQSLLYGADSIEVECEVWMTQMGGIY